MRWEDRSGRLIEYNILVAVVFTGVAISIGRHSILQGFALSVLLWIGLLGALFVVSLALDYGSDAFEIPMVRDFLQSKGWRVTKAALIALAAAVAAGACAAFVSIFLAPRLSAEPARQLLAMRVITAVPALLAGVLAGLASWKR